MSKYNDLQGSDTLKTMYPKINDNNAAMEADVTNLNNRVDNIVAQSGNDNTEIVDARNSIVKGKTFPVLGERLEEAEQDVINNTNTLTEHTNTLSTLVPDVDNIKNEISNAEIVTIGPTYESIIPTPPNAKGQVNVEWKGNTRTSLVKNGNLELGDTTHWSSGLTTENGYFKKTSNTSYLNGMQVIITNPIAGKKYTFSALGFRSGVGTSAVNRLAIVARDSSGSLINPAISLEFSNTTVERKSGVYTIPSGAKDVVIYPLAGTDVSVYFKEVLVEEGEVLYHYISGTKSTVLAQRIASESKNRLPNIQFYKGYYATYPPITGDGTDTINYRRTRIVYLEKGTYKFSSNANIEYRGIGQFQNTSGVSSGLTTKFTITQNQYMFFYFRKAGITTWDLGEYPSDIQLMLEQDRGQTLDIYEEHKDDKSYILCTNSETGEIEELRSVPNGTKDRLYYSNGKYYYEKNVSDEVIIDGSLGWATPSATGGGFYYSYVNNWIDGKNVATDVDNSGIAISSDGNYRISSSDITNERIIRLRSYSGRLQVYVETSKIDSQSGSTLTDKFKNYINAYPITLNYQLSTPIVVEANKPNSYGIDFKMEGSLTAYENGSVQFETYYRYVHDTNTTSITLKKPISSIDKLFKYDGGTWIEVTGTLSSDGTTITVTEAGTYRVEGPIRPEEGTEGEKTLSFATNLAERMNRIEDLAVNNASILSEHEIMLLTLAIQIIELQGGA